MLLFVKGETAERIYEDLPIQVRFKLCVAGYDEQVRMALMTLPAHQYHAAAIADVMERLLLVCLIYSQDKYNVQQAQNNLFIPLPDPRQRWGERTGLTKEDFTTIEKAMIANGYVVGKEKL